MSQKAQQSIEYAVILTLVSAGIIMGGPYVIRSWNAHIKSLEDSVTDSFNDPLLEEPDFNIPLPDCRCGPPLLPVGCGISPCEETQMASQETCTGGRPECAELNPITCVYDPTCCTHPEKYMAAPEYCGVNACTNISSKFPTLGPKEQADFRAALGDACDFTPPPPLLIRTSDGQAGCEDGYILYYSRCGDPADPTIIFSCEMDTTCDFNCDPEEPGIPVTWIKCKDDGDTTDETGLTGDTPRTFVYDCTADDDHKCEAKCCPDFCAEN